MKVEQIPKLIQGGMGIGVSGWKLARAVSLCGQLGVVSGTAMEMVMIRQLQTGDEGGHWRRALRAFPCQAVAVRILADYFIEGGKRPEQPFKPSGMISADAPRTVYDLIVAAGFSSLYLAKEGHSHPVGFNLLEKVRFPTLHALYGAMLAGVDVVLMGAGIPRQIPGVLDALAENQRAEYRIEVAGGGEDIVMKLDGADYGEAVKQKLQRPVFLPIVSSPVLADHLKKKSSGRIDGVVVEGSVAGGHNAPPRGNMTLDAEGQPVYGERDRIDPEKFRQLGLPFWLAGGYGVPGMLQEALAAGANGIQVGTPFAFTEESGLDPELKLRVLEQVAAGKLEVFTDPHASPTGYPFKVVQLEGTLSDKAVFEKRERVCDIGLLREPFVNAQGRVALRCASEPLGPWLAKGGDAGDCEGRLCLCNGLLAGLGLGQVRSALGTEPPLLTAGDGLDSVRYFSPKGEPYTAADVVKALLN